MHGAGNDYIYVNTLLYNIDDPSLAARVWSEADNHIYMTGPAEFVFEGEAEI